MVSGAEIRRQETEARRRRHGRAAACGAAVLAIGLAFVTKTELWFSIALMAMAALLIYTLFQLSWVLDAKPFFIACVRAVIGIGVVSGLVAIYGWMGWPKPHRHTLSEKEKAMFEEPLKIKPDTTVSIQMACPTNDEIDCVYASNLIPLFGEGGWNVGNQVDRVSLLRPMEGIVLVLHSTTNYVPKKWNEGVWTQMPPALVPIRKAFFNIGIEPDSNSGFSVPDGQIIVYVGPERVDESAPTNFTHTALQMEQMQNGSLPRPAEAK
jgi:hypothetical protein